VGKDGGLSSDNFLTDPRDCHWDPAALQCKGSAADAATCLTAPQVMAMRKFYEGPINPRTDERIYAGRMRGSESNSGYPAAIAPPSINSPYWVFGNDFDPLTFDFDRDSTRSTRRMPRGPTQTPPISKNSNRAAAS
jgi:feruloyl esterase